MIANNGWPPPLTIAGSFQRLAEHQVISPTTAAALQKLVSLRDRITIDCSAVEVTAVHTGSTAGFDDLEEFARLLAGWLLDGRADEVRGAGSSSGPRNA